MGNRQTDESDIADETYDGKQIISGGGRFEHWRLMVHHGDTLGVLQLQRENLEYRGAEEVRSAFDRRGPFWTFWYDIHRTADC